MAKAITDDNQIYRFSDYGIQSGKDGICFTLKANMGTWYDRVPIIKDNYGIRTIIIRYLSPDSKKRDELDTAYSIIRGTPPPDVCNIICKNL